MKENAQKMNTRRWKRKEKTRREKMKREKKKKESMKRLPHVRVKLVGEAGRREGEGGGWSGKGVSH